MSTNIHKILKPTQSQIKQPLRDTKIEKVAKTNDHKEIQNNHGDAK